MKPKSYGHHKSLAEKYNLRRQDPDAEITYYSTTRPMSHLVGLVVVKDKDGRIIEVRKI